MARPAPIVVAPTCPHCGNPMTPGGAAFLCGPDGGARLALPPSCMDAQCQRDRDAAAMARAIQSGLIRDASADAISPCPECEQGKCGNCDGTTWNYTTDEQATCPCAAAGHA